MTNFSTQINSISNNMTPTPDPTQNTDGTLHFQPGAPGGEVAPVIAPTENTSTTNENVQNTETHRSIEAYLPQEVLEEEGIKPKDSNNTQATKTDTQAPKPIQNVVDLRTGHEELHPPKTKDELTTIAATDETEFIKEVEKHHAK